ncbi:MULTISPECIES: thioredoxin fold domain-containing protein [unclassified Thioalkalivibrio]|uniref:thioredoxin family protein n=1 Tax=unclassified Thioalkalivibrio TaxID=2621013 RepID=UPI000377529A|nr:MULTISPECIES: thioredoxin fold domain-containing protein [unclassified Thioalkalivibrio]
MTIHRFPTRNPFVALLGSVSLLAGLLLTTSAAAGGVERATDLQALAGNGNGQPTLIMFASSSCPYCDRAEQRHLGPMAKDPAFAGVHIRKVMLDREAVRDFDGETLAGNALGRNYGVRVVPTIMAFDAEGRRAGTPLVGIPNEQLYRSQIRVRIEAARQTVRDPSS